MHSQLKHLALGLLTSAFTISPVAAKDGGSDGGGGKGAKKEQKGGADKRNKDNGSSDKGKDKPKTNPGHGAKPDKVAKSKDSGAGKREVPGDLRLAGIDANGARLLAKQHKFGGQKPLPPGIRKNLMRGKPLPPGIAHTRLPAGYLSALPTYPGYEWRAYGSDLVLVSVATNVAADVIVDALN